MVFYCNLEILRVLLHHRKAVSKYGHDPMVEMWSRRAEASQAWSRPSLMQSDGWNNSRASIRWPAMMPDLFRSKMRWFFMQLISIRWQRISTRFKINLKEICDQIHQWIWRKFEAYSSKNWINGLFFGPASKYCKRPLSPDIYKMACIFSLENISSHFLPLFQHTRRRVS